MVSAPPATVYGIISDYHRGHPSILPPQYFEDLVVEAGGQGAGTRIRFTMKSYGTRTVCHARISEPEPGRVLVETDERTGSVTQFIVEPLADGQTRVTFDTEYRARGLRGWIEALLVPAYLRKVYAAELELLAQRAEATRAPASLHMASPRAPEAVALIGELDADIQARYPGAPIHGLRPEEADDPSLIFYVVKVDGEAVGCGALRRLDGTTGEIKRMFVRPAYRGRGLALMLLDALEARARELGMRTILLETGTGQPEALGLYKRAGYRERPKYGEFVASLNSICMEKETTEERR